MLADKIRNLEIAVDEAKAAEGQLQATKSAADKRIGEAQAVLTRITSEAKGKVAEAEQAHAAAVQKVNGLRDEVRSFLNDILAGGRVRQ